MLFLSEREKREWRGYADEILITAPAPGDYDEKIRRNLVPAFHFYIATLLAAKGSGERSLEWLETGALIEEDGLLSCAYLKGFLERHENRLIMPAVVFQDPRPFIHFAGIPIMKEGRRQFVRQCGHSLPVFDKPIRCIDIGCGNGELITSLLLHLRRSGRSRVSARSSWSIRLLPWQRLRNGRSEMHSLMQPSVSRTAGSRIIRTG